MRWYLEEPLEGGYHKSRALMNRTNAFINDTPGFLASFHMWGHRKQLAIWNPEEGSLWNSIVCTLISDFPTPELWGKKLLFIGHIVYGIPLCQTSFKQRWINQTESSSVLELKGSYIFKHLNFVIKNSYHLHYYTSY